jgi:hypothetical protein
VPDYRDGRDIRAFTPVFDGLLPGHDQPGAEKFCAPRRPIFFFSAPTCRENCSGNQKRKLRNNRPLTTCHELVDDKARQMRAVRADKFQFARSPN